MALYKHADAAFFAEFSKQVQQEYKEPSTLRNRLGLYQATYGDRHDNWDSIHDEDTFWEYVGRADGLIHYRCGFKHCRQHSWFQGLEQTAATCGDCGKINRFPTLPEEENKGMNYSTAIFLINDDVQMVACSYELDHNDEPKKLYNFKSFDKTLKVGDMVIVPTDTRHCLTVVRVEELDVEPNLETSNEYKWIVGRVDLEDHEALLAQENDAIAQIKRAEKQRRRRELRESMLADMEEKKLLALPLATVPPVEVKKED
jgi:hypothetical protein